MCLHNQKILHDLVSSQKIYNQWFLSRMWLYSGGKVFNKTESNCWQEVIINKYSKFQVVREMIEFQQSRVIGNNNKSRKQIILIYFFFWKAWLHHCQFELAGRSQSCKPCFLC